ncbi:MULTISPECIES: hypothetical protein [unclassified Flavobacterium]|uniref:hypothetical protein n=1 Tax=unclassified Flavobacterium TaxID=196869 RepID=UPI0012913E39|nr:MULTISPECIES: hypothetical protein [unclassified Flavobacterium]MQP51544.1 hypothetical protein [Flavobacterium sp. LMO9]MQP61228.1 hypothetical protein [Flavobacterium sp. LMO6]
MSTNSQDQEIDLGQIGSGIKNFFNNCLNTFFDFIFFVKKKIILIGILFIAGIVLGVVIDKKHSYIQKMILIPNFGSNEYLYNKISLLESKLKEQDSAFFKSIGITNIEEIGKIEIKPINGIYSFINSKDNALNFEFIKLMAEDGNIEKIIKEDVTSKNYYQHELVINTSKAFKRNELIDPILKFLQDSDHFNKLKTIYQENITAKIAINNELIKQIDELIVSFSQSKPSGSVTISENSGLNGIINKKDELIKENQYKLLHNVEYDKIVKDQSIVSNQINSSGLKNKMKFILPILFVFLYLGFYKFYTLYKKQLARINS